MSRTVDQSGRDEASGRSPDVRLRASVHATGGLALDRRPRPRAPDNACAQRYIAVRAPRVSPGGDRKPAPARHPSNRERERALTRRLQRRGLPGGSRRLRSGTPLRGRLVASATGEAYRDRRTRGDEGEARQHVTESVRLATLPEQRAPWPASPDSHVAPDHRRCLLSVRYRTRPPERGSQTRGSAKGCRSAMGSCRDSVASTSASCTAAESRSERNQTAGRRPSAARVLRASANHERPGDAECRY